MTEAGKRLLEAVAPAPSDAADPSEEWVADSWAARNAWADRIVAIEAEAVTAVLDRLRDAVGKMATARIISQWDLVSRRAVLALIDEEAG
jgi:hypothetical protein